MGESEWLQQARNFTDAHVVVECGGYGYVAVNSSIMDLGGGQRVCCFGRVSIRPIAASLFTAFPAQPHVAIASFLLPLAAGGISPLRGAPHLRKGIDNEIPLTGELSRESLAELPEIVLGALCDRPRDPWIFIAAQDGMDTEWLAEPVPWCQ